MVTLATLDRLAELEERLDTLGLQEYRRAVDEALRALGSPAFRFLGTGEAAKALNVSIPTIKRWGRQGILPITRVRGRWLVPVESIERLKQAATRGSLLGDGSEAIGDIGAPLALAQQRRMLVLGRKANQGTLTDDERSEYAALIREAEHRSIRAAVAAVATRAPDKAASLAAEAKRMIDRPQRMR